MVDHNAFIDALSRDAAPVKRPLSPAVRTLIWTAIALPAGALAGLWLSRGFADWAVPDAGWAMMGLASAFVLGVLGMLSGFNLTIAGRRPVSWPWLAGAGLIWLAAGVAGVVKATEPWGHLGSGTGCYVFMMTASLPMIVLTIFGVRRTRTLYPARCLAVAGLGIAAMTAALLSLCHPPSGDLPDFLMHLLAAATIMVVTIGAGWRLVAIG